MSLPRTLVTIALSCSTMFGASLAAAADPEGSPSAPETGAAKPAPAANDPIQEARARYQRGVDLYQEGDYKLALIEFERANEVAPSYKILYNIGEVHFQLNNYALALKALERYLAEGGADITSKRRAEVEKDIQTLKARVAHLTIRADVAGAEVFVDDVLVGKTPLASEVLVDAGTRKVTATLAGHTSALKSITLAGQDSKTVELELPANAPALLVSTPPNYAAYVGWGATGLFAVGAVATGLLAVSANSKLNDLKNTRGVTAQEITDKSDERKTLAIATDVLTGAAVIAGGAALYFTIKGTKPSQEKHETAYVRPMLTPTSAGLVGTF